ncbi:MAG: DUF4833 domain-containing protein [Carboxylicivirga sp.]|nr:DUF4833 domain-containing protein [Carboxylicivirga sp.]MCT4647831.1 DUF4833 domain-containing protein [Carboxylicivirga sp.]
MRILFIHLLLVLNFASVANYPTPKKKPSLLFYIQRSLNTNTVIYEANFNEDGWLDPKNPVNAYWILYEKNRKKEGLSLIEKKYAYGIEVEACKNDSNAYWLRLVSQKQLPLKIVQTEPFKATTHIQRDHNHTYLLDHIFIQSDESGFWPKVETIKLYMHTLDHSDSLNEVITINP